MHRFWMITFQKLDPTDGYSLSFLQRLQYRSKLYLKLWAKAIIALAKQWVQASISFEDPKIKIKTGQNGQPVWQAWDPQKQEILYFSSEDQVRSWIENRYCDYR